jgi:pimeloyl-ACP methyl ester carboxylesterase
MNVVLSDGCTIRYYEVGRGVPVVLVHGTAARIWGASIDALAVDHRVISYDRRSFGESSHRPLANMSRHVIDAAELIEQVAQQPALVVGWSMGGLIALELAVSRPELVRGLALIEPPFRAKTSPTPQMLGAVAAGIAFGKLGWHRRGASLFIRGVLRHRDGAQGFDRLPPHVRESILANGPAITRELLSGTGEHLTAEQIGRIAAPIELLVGTQSEAGFGLAAEQLQGLLPHAEVRWIEGAGHCLQLDAPAAVATAIARLQAKRHLDATRSELAGPSL